jgi:hypothetical protein
MSTSKRKSAEQAAPSEDHSPEQVKEVALMLYARRPFEIRGAESREQWQSLIWQAFDFLDRLNAAYAFAIEFRRPAIAAHHGERKEIALASKLPLNESGRVPFNAVIKFITCEKQRHVKRATANFEMVVLNNPWAFPSGTTKRQLRAFLKHWRENGMSHEEAIELRWLFEKCYRPTAIATAGKRERRPRLNKKDMPVIRAVAQAKA